MCYEDQQEELPLLVVRGTGASLLGRNWLQKIRLNWQEVHQLQQIPALQETLKRYAEVFENELGKIKGMEARCKPPGTAPFLQSQTSPICLQTQGRVRVG